MAGASSGGDANYWPGFVDALTNVVIAMVFVIVVLALALSFSAQLLAKRMADKVTVLQQANAVLTAREAAATGSASAASSASTLSPAPSAPSTLPPTPPPSTPRAESNVIQPSTSTTISVKGDQAATAAPGGKLVPAAAALVLEYAGSALGTDEEAQRRLVEGLASVKEQLAAAPPGTRLVLVARGPNMAFSDNQRTAFMRVMLLRNTLLEQGFAADRLATRIETGVSPGRASVSLQLEKAP